MQSSSQKAPSTICDPRFSILVLTNVGEDDEACQPNRLGDTVAEIYLPAFKSRASPHQDPSIDADKLSIALIDLGGRTGAGSTLVLDR